eukprot:1982362-Amphidinium_carterae.1
MQTMDMDMDRSQLMAMVGAKPVRWRTRRTQKLSQLAAADKRQQVEDEERQRWILELWNYLQELGAPIVSMLAGARDAEDAEDIAQKLFRGMRAKTLRMRARRWRKVREWFAIAYGRPGLANPVDFAAYLVELEKIGAPKSVAQDAVAALHCLE